MGAVASLFSGQRTPRVPTAEENGAAKTARDEANKREFFRRVETQKKSPDADVARDR